LTSWITKAFSKGGEGVKLTEKATVN
jgi:hypothetical protein